MNQGRLFGESIGELSSPVSRENENLNDYRTLSELYQATKNCNKCQLGETRKNYVFGVGNEHASLVVVGEAPGAEEDEMGVPFIGRSGRLLTALLSEVSFQRSDVYISNIVKSRPPGNRKPETKEIKACLPYLFRQLEIIQPKLILAVGKVAANTLLENSLPLQHMRGKCYQWREIDVVVTFHPAALLRNPHWKEACRDDLRFLRLLFTQASPIVKKQGAQSTIPKQ